MRVVIDTNVFVSSFFGGTPREVIACWMRGEITLCVSRDLVDEYIEVLDRLGLQPALVKELLELLASSHHLVFVDAPAPVRVMANDADDNMLFACTAALKAKWIVTGDKAVRRVGRNMDIEVTTPAEFLAHVRAPKRRQDPQG